MDTLSPQLLRCRADTSRSTSPLVTQGAKRGKTASGSLLCRIGLLDEEVEWLAVEVGKLLQLKRIDPPLASLDLGDVLLPHTQGRRNSLLAHPRFLPGFFEPHEELAVALRVSRRHRRTIYPLVGLPQNGLD